VREKVATCQHEYELSKNYTKWYLVVVTLCKLVLFNSFDFPLHTTYIGLSASQTKAKASFVVLAAVIKKEKKGGGGGGGGVGAERERKEKEILLSLMFMFIIGGKIVIILSVIVLIMRSKSKIEPKGSAKS
jgi:cobalamin synthase